MSLDGFFLKVFKLEFVQLLDQFFGLIQRQSERMERRESYPMNLIAQDQHHVPVSHRNVDVIDKTNVEPQNKVEHCLTHVRLHTELGMNVTFRCDFDGKGMMVDSILNLNDKRGFGTNVRKPFTLKVALFRRKVCFQLFPHVLFYCSFKNLERHQFYFRVTIYMPQFRPRLRTVRESGNKKTETKKTKTKKAPIQIPTKLNHLRLRYSHANSSSSFNKNTLYRPKPILKKIKTKTISPSGNGWNLLTQELKKPSPKRISVRKYNESLPLKHHKIETRNVKPKLRFQLTTEKENLNALQREMNQPFHKVNPKGPLGSKI